MKRDIKPAATTMPARKDLKTSPALSILTRAKDTLEGRPGRSDSSPLYL